MATLEEVVEEDAEFFDYDTFFSDRFWGEAESNMTARDASVYSDAFPVLAADGVTISDALAQVSGVTIRETNQLTEAYDTTTSYRMVLLDAVRMSDLLRSGYPAAVTEGMSLADLRRLVLGGVVAEKLRLTEQWAPNAIYGRSIAEAMRISDILARMAMAAVDETCNLTDARAAQLRAKSMLLEELDLTASVTPQIIFSAVAHDTVELSVNALLSMILDGKIVEGVELSGAYLSPGGGFTAWAMNTRTGTVSEYDNFAFNSFAASGEKYLAASSEGLFELNGDTDDGDDIIARIRGGYMQFGVVQQSRLKAAYIAVRGEGDIVLKIETAEGQEYTYATSTRDMRTTKVHMGKGQRARYFAFELVTAGQDFDLESLEFVPIVVQRRV